MAYVEAQGALGRKDGKLTASTVHMARPIHRVGYGGNRSASGGSRGAARALHKLPYAVWEKG